jgi:ABC-type nitrate/sulfonate/bicarbonate transport system substrate-binding protein
MSRFTILFGTLFVSLVLISFSAPAQDKPNFPVRVASKTVGFSPVWAAWKRGFFERAGLDADLVLMRGAEKGGDGADR